MPAKLMTKYKLALAAIILAAVVFPFLAKAQALTLVNITGQAIAFFVYYFVYLTAYVAAAFFTFGGLFLSFGLKLNAVLLQSSMVNIGWSIVRDFANLGFVLGIIFIAIATILRSNKYGLKQILWRLIAAAIFINFSLTIAGVFIDASGLVTNFFVSKIVPQTALNQNLETDGRVGQATAAGLNYLGGQNLASSGLGVANALSNAFGVQRALEAKALPNGQYEGLTESMASIFNLITSAIFTMFFTIAAATLMAIIAGLVFVRYLYLNFLLIIMPLAWLGWVFPGSKFSEGFNAWWNKFLEWIIWLPVATFFLYLAIYITINTASDVGSIERVAQEIQGASGGSFDRAAPIIGGAFAEFGRMAAILGILAMGTLAAGKISDDGAKICVNGVQKGRDWAVGRMKSAYVAPARYMGRGAGYLGERTLKGALRSEKFGLGRGLVNTLSTFGLSGAATKLSGYIAGGKTEVEQAKKKYEPLVKTNPEAAIKFMSKLREPATKAALGLLLTKEGKYDLLSEEQRSQFKKAVKDSGVQSEYLDYRPDEAKEFNKTIAEVMAKITDPTKIVAEAFKNEEVVTAMSGNQWRKLGSDASEKTKSDIIKHVTATHQNLALKGVRTADEQIRFNKLNHVQTLLNTPAWSFQEIEKERREKIQEETRLVSDRIKNLKEAGSYGLEKLKITLRNQIDQTKQVNRDAVAAVLRSGLSPAQKNAEINNLNLQRDNDIRDLNQKFAKRIDAANQALQTKIKKIAETKDITVEKLKVEIDEIRDLFK